MRTKTFANAISAPSGVVLPDNIVCGLLGELPGNLKVVAVALECSTEVALSELNVARFLVAYG
jgi:hypothetical protein